MARKITLALVLTFIVAMPLAAAEWTGWITDEHCGSKGASSGHKSCALKCVEGGAKLVFYNPADEKTYALSDQAAAKEHLGEKVKVVGELDGETIKVESISAEKAE